MSREISQPLEDPESLEHQLVSYLDGELDPQVCRDIERRLSEEPLLRKRLQQHQKAWDLLDELPRAEASESFTHTTIEIVAVSANDEVQQMQRRARRRQIWLAVSCAAGVVLAAVGGYFFVSSLLLQPDRQLSKDLPIIENLDAYRNADSIGFLRALEHEGLFTGETEDAL